MDNLDYDQFRQIRSRRERTIWRGDRLKFEFQVLPTGWLFKAPVDINLVDGGNVHPLSKDNSYFDLGPLAGKLPPEARLGFSGFRITGPLNRPDLFDEIIVFQGASYFRALSRGQIYGLSARGLALNVGQSGGEEFPLYRRFWIEKPQAEATQIVIHALLDSPSSNVEQVHYRGGRRCWRHRGHWHCRRSFRRYGYYANPYYDPYPYYYGYGPTIGFSFGGGRHFHGGGRHHGGGRFHGGGRGGHGRR